MDVTTSVDARYLVDVCGQASTFRTWEEPARRPTMTSTVGELPSSILGIGDAKSARQDSPVSSVSYRSDSSLASATSGRDHEKDEAAQALLRLTFDGTSPSSCPGSPPPLMEGVSSAAAPSGEHATQQAPAPMAPPPPGESYRYGHHAGVPIHAQYAMQSGQVVQYVQQPQAHLQYAVGHAAQSHGSVIYVRHIASLQSSSPSSTAAMCPMPVIPIAPRSLTLLPSQKHIFAPPLPVQTRPSDGSISSSSSSSSPARKFRGRSRSDASAGYRSTQESGYQSLAESDRLGSQRSAESVTSAQSGQSLKRNACSMDCGDSDVDNDIEIDVVGDGQVEPNLFGSEQVIDAVRKFICNVCCDAFDTMPLLERHHSEQHYQKRPYSCDVCQRSFQHAYSLRVHRRSQHNDVDACVMFTCEYCYHEFASAASLRVHARMHTGERPYQCAECSKTFMRSHQLKMHQRTHTGLKPHVCQVCNKAFTQFKYLKEHCQRHARHLPYQCNICEKRFLRPSHLKKHGRVHVSERSNVTAAQSGEDVLA